MRISDWSSDVCSSDLELSRNLVFQALCGGERDLASGRDLHRFARARIASRAGRRRFDAEFSEAVDVDLFTGGGRVADRSDHAVDELASIGFADVLVFGDLLCEFRSEEHTSELQSLMRISYAVFCLKKKKQTKDKN